MAMNQRLRCITALILMSLEVTLSAETSPVPVYEVINEQSKAADRQINTGKTDLPYGNPLAGNSQTDAQLHAHNQQVMFNAERVRQHKAQLQRWTKTPLINNYMRAYHESQESHQLALEQQQAKVKDKPQSAKTNSKQIDPVEKSDSVMERKRNQRSYGSIEYQLVDPRYRNTPTVYTQTRIKPNTINQMVQSLTSKLYTEEDTRAYQKYYPSQEYSSIQNIETLNSLLNKNPGDQLTGFNALIKSAQTNVNHDTELETPIDLYFYLKDPHNKAEVNAQPTNVKDHTPIREDVNEADDISKPVAFLHHSVLAAPQLDVTATKNIEFINSELTSQILSTGYNPLLQEPAKEIEAGHQVHYIQPNSYDYDIQAEEDLSKRYLHHSNKGVQHLSEDGTISAYNDKLKYAARYEFGYRVRDLHSGNDFGHQEAKEGGATSGHYHVLLPDGRLQNVRYSAGPEGFHADITYDRV